MDDDDIQYNFTSRIDVVPGLGKKCAQRLIQKYKWRNQLGQLALALAEEKEKGQTEIFEEIKSSVHEEEMWVKCEKGLNLLIQQYREKFPKTQGEKKAVAAPKKAAESAPEPKNSKFLKKKPKEEEEEDEDDEDEDEEGGKKSKGKKKKGKKSKKKKEESEEEEEEEQPEQVDIATTGHYVHFRGLDISKLPQPWVVRLLNHLPEKSIVALSSVNKALNAVVRSEDGWQRLCSLKSWTPEKLAKASKGASFTSWQNLHQQLRLLLCSECGNQTPYHFVLLNRTLCEPCERKFSTKYRLVTPLDASEDYLLGANELKGLKSMEVPSPGYITPTIRFYLKTQVRAVAINKFGSEEELEEELLKRRMEAQAAAKAPAPPKKKRGGASEGGPRTVKPNPRAQNSTSNWAEEKKYIELEYGQYGISGLKIR